MKATTCRGRAGLSICPRRLLWDQLVHRELGDTRFRRALSSSNSFKGLGLVDLEPAVLLVPPEVGVVGVADGVARLADRLALAEPDVGLPELVDNVFGGITSLRAATWLLIGGWKPRGFHLNEEIKGRSTPRRRGPGVRHGTPGPSNVVGRSRTRACGSSGEPPLQVHHHAGQKVQEEPTLAKEIGGRKVSAGCSQESTCSRSAVGHTNEVDLGSPRGRSL